MCVCWPTLRPRRQIITKLRWCRYSMYEHFLSRTTHLGPFAFLHFWPGRCGQELVNGTEQPLSCPRMLSVSLLICPRRPLSPQTPPRSTLRPDIPFGSNTKGKRHIALAGVLADLVRFVYLKVLSGPLSGLPGPTSGVTPRITPHIGLGLAT